MPRVCVFCASSVGADASFGQAARAVGASLARRGIGVVYGGGKVGLMGMCADAALTAGGEVVGVIPRGLETAEVAHRGLTKLHVTASMHERKQLMHELSDGFVTLPGGFGTMDELFEALTWRQLGIHEKPIAVLNLDGFYDSLLSFADVQVNAGLLHSEYRSFLRVHKDVETMLDDVSAAFPAQSRSQSLPKP